MHREIARGEQLVQLYTVARRIVPKLDISREGITYYSSLVSYYSVFRLKQLDTWMVYLYLLCFIVHRYQRFNDHLLTCFIHLVKQYSDEAKATAKRAVYEYRGLSHQDLPKAGEVLKLFTAEYESTTPFCTVQEQAFALLDRQRLTRVAEYISNEANCDEMAFEWEHIDSMTRRCTATSPSPLSRHRSLCHPSQRAHPRSYPLSQDHFPKRLLTPPGRVRRVSHQFLSRPRQTLPLPAK